MKLENILKLSYDEYVVYLKVKYGKATEDYCKLSGNNYTYNSNISRVNEGLMIHHVLEDRYVNLGNSKCFNFVMNNYPEAHSADNLVYCNYLEHLLLHIKIVENIDDDKSIYGWGGIYSLMKHINSAYQMYYMEGDYDYTEIAKHGNHRPTCSMVIIKNLNDYLTIIDYMMNNVMSKIIKRSEGHISLSEFWYTYNLEFEIAKVKIKSNPNFKELSKERRKYREKSKYNSMDELYKDNY